MQLASVDRPAPVCGGAAWLSAPRRASRPSSATCRRDLLLIPGVAIHMNRAVNEGVKLDTQKDTLPLLGGSQADLKSHGGPRSAGVSPRGHPLLGPVPVQPGSRARCSARRGEYIAAPPPGRPGVRLRRHHRLPGRRRIRENVTVLALFDNEETGSLTRQGADSHLPRPCAGAGRPWLLRQGAGRSLLPGRRRGLYALRGQCPRRPPGQPGEVRPHQPLLLKRAAWWSSTAPATPPTPSPPGVFQRHLPEGRGAGAGVLQQLQESRAAAPWATCPAPMWPCPRWTSACPSCPCTPPMRRPAPGTWSTWSSAMEACYKTAAITVTGRDAYDALLLRNMGGLLQALPVL